MHRTTLYAFSVTLLSSILFSDDLWAGYSKMYWVDSSTDKIQCSNLDGTGVEDLITTGLEKPRDIALDDINGKMYITDSEAGKIFRANLDGTGMESIFTTSGSPLGIALDIAGGKVYWTDFDTNKIQRSNLDGSLVEDLITTGLDVP